MNKKILALTVVTIFFMGSLLAQEKPKSEKFGNHIGLFAGPSSGYGLSYRYLKNKFGFQLTTTPIFSHNGSHLSIGGDILKSFIPGEFYNFYGYIGYHYNYTKSVQELYDGTHEEIDVTQIAGVGVGFELIAGNRVSFNWQMGYGFFYFGTDDWRTLIDGGIGVYYKF